MIPVLKPLLPDTDAILPYLRQIDAARWYGNDGPMVKAFEQRIAEMYDLTVQDVTLVANGTLGLTVALQAYGIERGALCLLPSWTFTATVAAVLAAGLNPCFVDVDYQTQTISPALIEDAMEQLGEPIGAVVPVSPFGTPIDTLVWDKFSEENSIPVVIDAAAAFDAIATGQMKVGRCPIMVSLHATKALGIGEGGLMLTRDEHISFQMGRIINFGFENSRLSHRIAINAKPSEYDAAVGMAALDVWPETRAGFARVQAHYRYHLGRAGIKCWLPPDVVSSTCNIICAELAVAFSDRLKSKGIDTRRWWETGCHTHPAYRGFPTVGALPHTRWLSKSVLGLPCAMDMPEADLNTVCDEVLAILSAPVASEHSAAGAKRGA